MPAATRVRIGVEAVGLLSHLDEKGQPAGYSRELLREMSKVDDVEFEILAAPWSFIHQEFQAGRLDALVNVAITDERLKTMDFSIAHASVHGITYSRNDRPRIQRTADLAGKRIGMLEGSMERFNAIKHGGWGSTLVTADDVEALLGSVARGELDAALLARRLDKAELRARGLRSEFVDDIVHRFHIAVHKGDSATLARLNESLATIRHNGSFDEIYSRWVGPIEPHPIRFTDLRPYYLPISAGLLAVLVIIFWQRHMLMRLKRQSQALLASEEQFRSAMDFSPIGKALVAPDGRWLEVNQALCRIVGYSREEMLVMDFQSLTHPDNLSDDLEGARQLLAGDIQTYAVEKRYRHKDGHTVWVQLNVSLLRNPDGTPRHFISQIQDITSRKNAEAERLRLVHALGERVKELTLVHKTARLLQQERPFARELLADLVALLPPAWQYPEICEARVSFASLEAATAGWRETPWMQSVEFRTRDGIAGSITVAYREERPAEVEGPFLAEERTLLQSLADMLAAYVDRKTGEAALRESRAKLMAVNQRYERHEAALSTLTRSYALQPGNLAEILRGIAEVVARTLEVGRVSLWSYNPARAGIRCLELFERSGNRHSEGGELARAGHEPYFDALDSSDVIAATDALADPRTSVLADSHLRPLGIQSMLDAPLHSRGVATGVLCCEHTGPVRQWTPDEQTFAVAVANLVSMLFAQLEQQSLEAQLRQTQKLEALGTLAGGIAHDFNNILGAIISYTELARMDHPADRELQENLGEVLKASHRATGLVRQILAFSRQQKQERKPIQIKSVVAEVLKLIRSTLPATIEIRPRLADELPLVLGDATQMHQVIMNLCTNAGHAMRGKAGVLTVELKQAESAPLVFPGSSPQPDGGTLELIVTDTGHGMDAATLSRIFDPFFTTKATGEGTGLGLAVVHGIIKDHEGAIEVESAPGVGTTFRIQLPAVPRAGATTFVKAQPLANGQGRRILFVDDEVALAEGARRLLARFGFEVEARYLPEDALSLVRQEPDRFDAVITDLMMPRMTGAELATRILKLRSQMPVFVMTGNSADFTTDSMKALGVCELVHKPLDYPALANALCASITRYRGGMTP